MADARLQVVIEAADRTADGMKSVQRRVEDVSRQLRNAGLAMTAFGAAGILSIKSFVSAASEQNQAMATLATVAQNTGQSFDALKPKVEAVTLALQRKTNFADEEQIRVLAMMVPILGSVDKALAALPAVLDVASVSGQGLETAARGVAEALNMQSDTIIRTGIQFEKTAGPTERLRILTQKLGGAAAANADPFKIMSNQMGELKEKIGNALIPVLTPLIDGFIKLSDTLQKIDPQLLSVGAALGVVAVGITSVLGPLALLASQIPKIVGAFSGMAAILTGPWGLAIVGALALLGGGILIWAKSQRAIEDHTQALKSSQKAIEDHTQALKNSAEGFNTFSRFMEITKSKIGGYTALLKEMQALQEKILRVKPEAPKPSLFGAEYQKELDKVLKAQANAIKQLQVPPSLPIFEEPDRAAELAERINKPLQAMREELEGFFKVVNDPSGMQRTLQGMSEFAIKTGIAVEKVMALRLAFQLDQAKAQVEDLAKSLIGGMEELERMRSAGLSLGEQYAALTQEFLLGMLKAKDAIPPVIEGIDDVGAAARRAAALLAELGKIQELDELQKNLRIVAEAVEGGTVLLDQLRRAGMDAAEMWRHFDEGLRNGTLRLKALQTEMPEINRLMDIFTSTISKADVANKLLAVHIRDQLQGALTSLASQLQGGIKLLNEMTAAGVTLTDQFRVLLIALGKRIDLSPWQKLLDILEDLEYQAKKTYRDISFSATTIETQIGQALASPVMRGLVEAIAAQLGLPDIVAEWLVRSNVGMPDPELSRLILLLIKLVETMLAKGAASAEAELIMRIIRVELDGREIARAEGKRAVAEEQVRSS